MGLTGIPCCQFYLTRAIYILCQIWYSIYVVTSINAVKFCKTWVLRWVLEGRGSCACSSITVGMDLGRGDWLLVGNFTYILMSMILHYGYCFSGFLGNYLLGFARVFRIKDHNASRNDFHKIKFFAINTDQFVFIYVP